LEYYTDSTANAATDGRGNLVITAKAADGAQQCYYGPCKYTSARLLTKDRFEIALGNDTDADADPLTATLVSGPAHGVLTLGTTAPVLVVAVVDEEADRGGLSGQGCSPQPIWIRTVRSRAPSWSIG
jgi:hypothetical protein